MIPTSNCLKYSKISDTHAIFQGIWFCWMNGRYTLIFNNIDLLRFVHTLTQPLLPKRSYLGLWMTLASKFIQEEDVEKVTICITVLLHETFLWMAMSPFQNERWLFTRIFFQSQKGLIFPFLMQCYIWKFIIILVKYFQFYMHFFPYFKAYIYFQWNTESLGKVWSIIPLHVLITIYWSRMILNRL